jgi:hypothetical protein
MPYTICVVYIGIVHRDDAEGLYAAVIEGLNIL